MKRLFSVFLIVLLLTSCQDAYISAEDQEKSEPQHQQNGQLYIVNTSTRVYHLPSCYIVSNMDEENKYETRDLAFLVERDYSKCGICLKNDD